MTRRETEGAVGELVLFLDLVIVRWIYSICENSSSCSL